MFDYVVLADVELLFQLHYIQFVASRTDMREEGASVSRAVMREVSRMGAVVAAVM